ncbi:MAG: sensor histidine kinase [Acidimicrobiales bacterium]
MGRKGNSVASTVAGTAGNGAANGVRADEGAGRPFVVSDRAEAPARPLATTGRRRRHLTLRARVTTTFALGALVLATLLASVSYFSVRSSVLNQEQATLTRTAIGNAEAMNSALDRSGVNIPSALESLDANPGLESLLNQGGASGNWFPSSTSASQTDLPQHLRSLVLAGHLAEQIVSVKGQPELIVGVPIPSAKSAYFEIFSLSEIANTLRALFGSLALGAVVTAIGGAVLGLWAAGRALRPLHQTAEAALSIAGGELGTRLRSDDYADLAVLTSAFNKMADRLQERIEREARFTSDVNHELRSPLTTLAASLSVIESRREEMPERAQQALDLLSAEVGRFRRLVDDLLEISRLDAGLGDVNVEEVGLGALVDHAVTATRHVVMVEAPPGVAGSRVVVDKRRFERVISNLVENADRYAGGVTRVAVDSDGRWARIAVEDRGPGIPQEEREHIFDRFARGSSGRRRGLGAGTGLGLSIVRQHVNLLGGRVWIESNGARGSRFVVEIPVVPAEGPPESEET